MKVTYFYRKKRNNNYSIEELFKTVSDTLSNRIDYNNVYAEKNSKGIINRLLIMLQFFRRQGDINHVTGDIHFATLLLKRSKTILTICDVKPLDEKRGLRRKLIWLFWFYLPVKRVKFVTVISKFTKMQLLRHVKMDPNKIKVIYCCIPFMGENYYNLPNSEERVLLHIGTRSNKNLENLIPAIKGIKCKLLVIGKLEPAQKQMLKDCHVEYENRWDLSREEIYQCYLMSDIVCFISRYEGFGMPIIEANAVGKPVITSNLGAMREIAGNAAILVNPYDIKDIRGAILDLLNNEELRSRLIKNGYENAKKFEPEKVADQYYELYRAVATGG